MSGKYSSIVMTSLMAFFPFLAIANTSENNDFFRNIGKINVVLAVILIIFVGIIAYLVYIDRKLSRLEKESEE